MATLLDKLRAGPANRMCRESLGERAGPSLAATPTPAKPDPNAGWRRDAVRRLSFLELARIKPDPTQPRTLFDADELDRLADSVRDREARSPGSGIMQPPRVRWDGESWILVAGERRYRAAIAAGLVEIPAMPIDGLPTAADVLEDQIAEQLLRAGWTPIEEARAFRSIMELRHWEPQGLCKGLRLSKTSTYRSLALLELHDEVQALVHALTLTPTAAVELRKLPLADQPAAAAAIVGEGLTVEQTAERVATQLGKPAKAPRIHHKQRVLKIRGLGKLKLQLDSGETGDTEVFDAIDRFAALRPRKEAA